MSQLPGPWADRISVVLSSDPVVTVAIPMLNEMGAIEACLDSFASQDYPQDLLDILVIDGGSTDGSREYVEQRSLVDKWVRVVHNPAGSAAAAFNIGARWGKGEVVCLFSSHGVPATDYVSRSVKVLRETSVVGVGGRYHHIGTTSVSNATGLAMASRFGMASSHRFARRRQLVDTISHPAYLRQALLDIGGFDESLARNSDYEINVRLRQAGHKLMFDPLIESIYRPRPTVPALARQFWHYGRWKARVVRQHPGDVKARHLVAPAMALGAALTPAAVAASPVTRVAAAVSWSAYGAACSVAVGEALRTADKNSMQVSIPSLVAAFPAMHLCWGFGFLASAIQDTVAPSTTSRRNRITT